MFIDLHVHTKESDGSLSVNEVLELASKKGIQALSLTDHETTHGVEIARKYKDNFKLKIIPGVELVTAFQGHEVHLLGYFNDSCLENLSLQARLKELRYKRTSLAFDMVKRLQSEGLSLKWSEVEGVANPEGTVSKGHIMYVLHDQLNKNDVPWSVIAAFFQPGGAAYIPFLEHAFEDAVDLIYSCHGIPVLAHPGLLKDPQLVNQLLEYRPIGLEVYYGYWEKRADLIAKYEALGREKAILTTGGSDFHGPYSLVQLGQINVPNYCFDDLKFKLDLSL
ncbi:PHP domain-containing protein [Desulfitobacterium sp. Sab5]|uniref:PHP domain-containing protein n=1 Tax=Desulfitobacterium TaxID=36853 RepID=UPI003CEF36F7